MGAAIQRYEPTTILGRARNNAAASRQRASAVAPATIPRPGASDRWPSGRGNGRRVQTRRGDLIEAPGARAWVTPFTPEVKARDMTFYYSEADHEASSEP